MSVYLAFKEAWRDRGRFILFSLVIALITILVLFVAALGNGLANANRQFIDKLEVDYLILQENVDLNLSASRLSRGKLNDVRRINGVAEAGLIAAAAGTIVSPNGAETLDVSLIGVEPGALGTPTLLAGQAIRQKYGNEIIIDTNTAETLGLAIGDTLTIKTIQGEDDEFFNFQIVGITDERQYLYAPAVIMPLYTWDEVRPQVDPGARSGQPLGNFIAIRLQPEANQDEVLALLNAYVDKVEIADPETLIQSQPGYGPQQVTIQTQRGFALFIGVLVVGGFFQIQTLQKVPQIGMLKAIGTGNFAVGAAALIQIVLVTIAGILIGGLGVLMFSLVLPESVPLRFNFITIITAIASLMLIGPIGGMVSIRLALKVEPLTAIGLSS